jgi:transcriptional regulator with XRE-family HTH domain
VLIGTRLRKLREAKKLSQGDLEARTGLPRWYISRVENGHTVPSLETLERLASALEIPLYQLFYEGDEPPPLPNLLRFLEKLRRLISELAREPQGHEARQRYFHGVVLEIRDGANECAMANWPSPEILDLIVYLSSKHAVGTTRVLASLMKATLLLRVLRDVRDFSVKQRVVLTAIIHHFVEIVRNILCPTTRPL